MKKNSPTMAESVARALAELGLQVGDRLKYVYDFGDWIEPEIRVENVESPQGSTSESR